MPPLSSRAGIGSERRAVVRRWHVSEPVIDRATPNAAVWRAREGQQQSLVYPNETSGTWRQSDAVGGCPQWISRRGALRVGLSLELSHSVGLDGRDCFAAIDDEEYSDAVFECACG